MQRLAPGGSYGRVFVRYEVLFQLAWVGGALIPALAPIDFRERLPDPGRAVPGRHHRVPDPRHPGASASVSSTEGGVGCRGADPWVRYARSGGPGRGEEREHGGVGEGRFGGRGARGRGDRVRRGRTRRWRSPTSRATCMRSTTRAPTSSARSPRANSTARSIECPCHGSQFDVIDRRGGRRPRGRPRRRVRDQGRGRRAEGLGRRGVTAFVVVGAGVAGATAAAKLREEGFDGDLVLIGAEPMAPYERPPLSKEYLRGESDHHFVRPPEWYAEHAIDARFGARAERVNVDRTRRRARGRRARAVRPGRDRHRRPEPQADDRRPRPARRVRPPLRARRRRDQAGGEGRLEGRDGRDGVHRRRGRRRRCASSAWTSRSSSSSARRWSGCSGPTLGGAIEALHRDHGVEMIFRDGAERFEGDGRFEALVTKEGRTIEGDFAVVGRRRRARHRGRRGRASRSTTASRSTPP